MWHRKSLVGVVIVIGILSGSLRAQSNAGSITGTITDPTGANVTSASITAVDVATGQVATTISSSAGDFRFPSLQVGDYKVTVTSKGFKSAERTSVVVQIGTTTTLEISLAAGSQTETVTITADAPQLQTESSDVGTVVTPRQVLDLPLSTNGNAIRNSQSFVFLTPATYGTGTGGGTFEGGVSGGQAFGSEILFDGASLQVESFGDGFADEILPSVEATGEFKVLIGGIPAQYGRTSGGIQSYASKSGTNLYHGTGFLIYRDTAFDANTWFNNRDRAVNGANAGNVTPPDNKKNYGLAFGGPVRIPHLYDGRDKTFFFFAWEQFKNTQGYAGLITLPTPANLTGDYSANLTTTVIGTNPCDGSNIYQGQIFDPSTAKTVGGVQCRTAYPGNIIPAAQISPVASAISAYIPKASTALTNNYNFAGSYPIISTAESMRFDHSLNQNNKFFVSYNVRDNVRNNNLGGTLQLPITPFITSQDLPTHLIRGGYDRIFSPTLLNHLTVGFTRVLNKEGFITPSLGKDFSQLVGLPGGDGLYFPGIAIQDSTSAFGNPVDPHNDGYNSKISDNSFYLGDNVSFTKGRHNLSIGGEYRYAISISSFLSLHNGTFDFSREQTAASVNSANGSGNGFASFLLGQVGSATVKQNFITSRNIGQYEALYLQDEFKVLKDLNLSLGIRYDVDLPFKESHDFGSQFSPAVINSGAAGTGTLGALVFAGSGSGKDGLSSRWSNVYYKNIEPRLGFSYAPGFLNHKTVLSASYSALNSPILQWQQIYGGLPAGYSNISQINNTGNGFSPAELLDPGSRATPLNLHPGSFGVPSIPTTASFDRSQRNGQDINYTKRDFGKPGFDQTYTASVQQEFAPDLIFTLGYLGERGVHLGSNLLYLNDINPSNFTLGTKLSDPFDGSGAAVDGVASPFAGFTGNVAQALRPYPQYNRVNTGAYGENHGQLSYNALTAKLERRYRNGLNLLASYTWSKILTDTGNIIGGSLGGAYTSSIQNPFNPKGEKSVSPQDVPQIFVVSYLYDLPVGKGRAFLNNNKFVDYAIGGWSVSGIQRYQSGQPNGFGCATGVPGFDNCIRYTLVPGVQLQSDARRSGKFNPTTDVWYNPKAVVDQNQGPAFQANGGAYTFGTKPQYQSNDRGFAFLEEDFALIKRTHITEQLALQFRVETFNAFNRHVFGGPDGNPNDPGFGTVGGLNNSPRALQLTLRAEF
ncbi:hypothetical protein HDF16_005438 [Granulicella aggregans]|uniref:TonB-dependent transporter Oar-like beta-barrel domain-containing protein n=1 Tax=Granulicella aggregans TaxID=474949 RepID=A0A7W7ZJ14_9BACT|nr:carboxypeptidase-like regulatory domain-containing protein [Granulicella aggregans]MBB5060702.1 hypothetical protein [Granulicella aggregans]